MTDSIPAFIPQERHCDHCGNVDIFNGWMVDGYGFTPTSCSKCGKVSSCWGPDETPI